MSLNHLEKANKHGGPSWTENGGANGTERTEGLLASS